jgi:hypothetical protein
MSILKIKRNAAKCRKCQVEIESFHVHDFKSCMCQSIFIDGGKDYLKRGGASTDIIELAEFETLIESLRTD